LDLTLPHSIRLSGVVSKDELARSLRRVGQAEWCTNVRLHGLLMLIDYLCRNFSRHGVSIPADLAHDYISNLKCRRSLKVQHERSK